MPYCTHADCNQSATHVVIEDLEVVAEPEVFLCQKHANQEGYSTCYCCDDDEQETSEGVFKPTWTNKQVHNGTCGHHP